MNGTARLRQDGLIAWAAAAPNRTAAAMEEPKFDVVAAKQLQVEAQRLQIERTLEDYAR